MGYEEGGYEKGGQEEGGHGGSGGEGSSQILTRYDIWDLNMGLISGHKVNNPPGWDDISLHYARALQKMGYKRNPATGHDVETMWTYSEAPNSYYFQAAMHWTPKWPASIPPPPYNAWWNHCTHGPASAERFFLPWHRIFIYWYEVIIREYVQLNNGPPDWALPYWNYSHYDASAPDGPWPRAKLPWVFCQPTLPDDGSDNPLYIDDMDKRGLQPKWPGTSNPMFLEETTPYYDQAYNTTHYDNTATPGFNPTLDGQPHGAVHVDTGSGDGLSNGWMRSTVYAAFDPIFWLHHSEIDRFWVGWNVNGGPNPTDSGWLNATSDPLYQTRWNFWGFTTDNSNPMHFYPGQFLDPGNLPAPCPYSYGYQNLPQTPAPTSTGRQLVAQSVAGLAAEGVGADPVLASEEKPVELGKEPVTTELALTPEAAPVVEGLAAGPEEASRVVLDLEHVVADGPPGNYEVYLNYPEADQETKGSVPHYVGLLAGFGADHVHGEGHEHGVSAKYDITDIVNHLRQEGDWDESKVTLTFVPAHRVKPEDLVVAPMRVGKMSITST